MPFRDKRATDVATEVGLDPGVYELPRPASRPSTSALRRRFFTRTAEGSRARPRFPRCEREPHARTPKDSTPCRTVLGPSDDATVLAVASDTPRRPGCGVIDETWRRRIRTSDRPPPSPRATSRSSRRIVRVEVSDEGEPQIGGPLLLALLSTVPWNAWSAPPSFGQVLRLQRSVRS
jgi:hypothetical protein